MKDWTDALKPGDVVTCRLGGGAKTQLGVVVGRDPGNGWPIVLRFRERSGRFLPNPKKTNPLDIFGTGSAGYDDTDRIKAAYVRWVAEQEGANR